MKEVGDKFGAGELILPFVLQSAEVMKRAVAKLEEFLDRIEGYTKGTVVLATVFGDVHDIGKSLVNTILTNNGYSVVDLGKQVPIGTILDAAKEHEATAIGLCALLVSTSKQMPLAVQELHQQGFEVPVLIGGAAINRNFGRRILYPGGRESEDIYEPRRLLLQGRLRGPGRDGPARRGPTRASSSSRRCATRRACCARRAPSPRRCRPTTTPSAPRRAPTSPVPTPPFWGVQEIDVDMDEVYRHLDTHVLFKLHWGGRGVKGEAWKELVENDFLPRLERMWAEQDYLQPRALLGYFPCRRRSATPSRSTTPRTTRRVLETFVFPRQPKGERLCIADFYRPKDSGELDVVAFQAVTAGSQVTELMAELEKDGEFAEQLFTHGLGVQVAEGMAEWLHWKIRNDFGIPATQGRRWAWGYPACPEQSEHEKLFRVLGAESIGLSLSGGHAVEPEQSTVAIVSHHPQAIYFSMKQGRLVSPEKSEDEVIRGTDRDPTLFAIPDAA